jgi:hypothetical protein
MMTHIESVAVVAQATFGRDGAMFEGLLDFVAQLSVVLWGMVFLTVVLRFVGIRIYRYGAARRARLQSVAPSPAVPASAVTATTTGTDAELVPGDPADAGLVDALAHGIVPKATFDEARQPAETPAAVATSAKWPRRAPRNRRSETRSSGHVPALAANSTEA